MTQKPHITTVEQLREIDPAPCKEALEWLAESGITDLADAWDRCHRADWMLWLSNDLDLLSDRECRLIACRCVRETPLADGRKVWDLLIDDRSRHAVTVAERYADGAATDEELAAAYVAARTAADTAAAAATAAATAAASAAADAAQAATACAYGAREAAEAYAAYATQADASAVIVVRAAAADAARAAQADIVRAIAGNPFR